MKKLRIIVFSTLNFIFPFTYKNYVLSYTDKKGDITCVQR